MIPCAFIGVWLLMSAEGSQIRLNVTSDGLDASRDRHRPVIGMKSYGEKADRQKAGLEQRP